jgi:hypothetical protein
MSDPIRDLENLKHEGLNVNPLPASEVRRRGTRMRRRNNALATVGALAVITVIATPLAVMARGGDHAEPGPVDSPSPSPTQTEQAGWKQTVPASFDLTALPGGATFRYTARDDSVIDDLTLCGRPTFSTRSNDPVGPALDTAGATYGEAGTESSSGRTLALYSSDKLAAKTVEAIRHGVDVCPTETEPGRAPLVYAAVDTELPTDDSYVFTEQSKMDKDLYADLTVFQVARVGNAVYLATSHTSAGGAQVVDGEVRRLAEWSAPVLSDMCVFAAEPCDSPSALTSSASASPVIGEGAVSAIPADFPLDRNIATPEGGPLDGPSAQSDGVRALDLCGASVWPAPDTVERLAVTSTMPQYRESRELVTFASTADVMAALDRIRSAVQACPTVAGDNPTDDQVVTPLAADLPAADDSVTFSITYAQGLGGGVYQFARVGRALVGTYNGGEWSTDSAATAVTAITEKTGALLPDLCPWTTEGC